MENKSNKTTLIISSVIVAIVVIGGISILASTIGSSKTPTVANKSSDAMMKKEGDKMMENKSTMSPAEMEKMKADEAMQKSGDLMSKMTPEEKMAFDKLTPDQKMEKEKMMMQSTTSSDSMMKKDEAMMKKEEGVMSKTGYIAYSAEALASNSMGKNIIFFHAPWCPTCKAVNADITTNASKIPAGTNILKADYDTSTDLKKKYGVTQQHTFVVVDGQGTLISKSQGQPTLDAVLALVK